MFKTEKHAREETIGAAVAIAELANGERRGYTAAEAERVEGLLTTAETLRLGKAIPREPRQLINYSQRKQRGKRP